MVELRTPAGAKVTVPEHRVETLLARGWARVRGRPPKPKKKK